MRSHGLTVDGLGSRLASWNERIELLLARAPDGDAALGEALESLRHKRDAVENQLRLLTRPGPRAREEALHQLPRLWHELDTAWAAVVHHLEATVHRPTAAAAGEREAR